jgi:hypothetical protein
VRRNSEHLKKKTPTPFHRQENPTERNRNHRREKGGGRSHLRGPPCPWRVGAASGRRRRRRRRRLRRPGGGGEARVRRVPLRWPRRVRHWIPWVATGRECYKEEEGFAILVCVCALRWWRGGTEEGKQTTTGWLLGYSYSPPEVGGPPSRQRGKVTARRSLTGGSRRVSRGPHVPRGFVRGPPPSAARHHPALHVSIRRLVISLHARQNRTRHARCRRDSTATGVGPSCHRSTQIIFASV